MLSSRLEEGLNEQMKNEFYSAYLYLSMAAFCDSEDLVGFAHWFKEQAKEEEFHAMKFYDYINDRNGEIELQGIEAPENNFDSLRDVFETSFNHEQKVTEMINDLMDIAKEEGDHASINFLNWFVEEQVEEEDQFETLLNKIKRIGEEGNVIYNLDKEVGQRQFNPPTDNE